MKIIIKWSYKKGVKLWKLCPLWLKVILGVIAIIIIFLTARWITRLIVFCSVLLVVAIITHAILEKRKV